jgi:hypothetical protein
MQQETQRGPQNTTVATDTTERNGRGDERHPIEDRYNFHDASFRRHYQLNYHDGPHAYEYYAPAYRFGYELAEESAGSDWEAAQPEAQRHWQSNHDTAWDEMREAIHYGWREQRNPDALRVHHHGDYSDFRKSFETHYAEAAATSGAPFEHYEPAYRYGYELAIDPAYNSHLWAEVEPQVREYYETEYADGRLPWEHYRDAVSHAWYGVRATG